MDTIEKKRIYQLDKNEVFIDTKRFALIEGKETQIGEMHSDSYRNSISDRERLQDKHPDLVEGILMIWGEPEEPKLPEGVTESPLPDNESKNSNSIKTSIDKDENL